ncbi:hypothetical protein HD806DRAFT_482389 [Xylariaceae sp. AK1471]|nr:hypothetical protein HD806DRAFT_482389 [Xylariaceae sp. AK1471]
MLHVARESRQVLLDSGYELAFRTRTHGPRIWFNFKKDILYIDRTYHDDQDLFYLLSGNQYWDIGQYQPADLKRVRRIALGKAGRRLGWFFDQTVHDMSNILQLFTGVEELFIDEQSPRQLVERFSRHKNMSGDQLWSHTSVLEVDVLSCLIEDEYRVESTGYYNYDLKVYKENNMGDGSRYFVDTAGRFEEELVKRRDELVREESIAPWKVPKVNIVYICYPWVLRQLFDWRWIMWNRFQRLKEEEARSKAAEEARRSISVPSKLIYDQDDVNNLPPSPFTEKYRDDLEVYEEAYRMAYEDYAYENPREQHRWLMQATVAAPDHEIQ